MGSIYHELLAEYQYLGTQDGQVQRITDRTSFSDVCVRRVLVHLSTQPLFGEEWDLEAQARRAGLSVEDYAVAMAPLMQMSLEQAQGRLREIEGQIARGDEPELSIDELQNVRKWEAMVERIASLSGQEHDVVMAILFLATGLKNRQREILKELARLKASGKGPSGAAL